jgi:hypothetical protein
MEVTTFLIMVFLAIIAFPVGVLISNIEKWFNNRKIRKEWDNRNGKL